MDIAKESSDAFPPLKSCLGGINALIKHYDVGLSSDLQIPQAYATQEYKDVKDKLGDLIPWLEKLLVTFAKVNPNNDHDEAERRSELAKFASCRKLFVYPRLIPTIDCWETSKHER